MCQKQGAIKEKSSWGTKEEPLGLLKDSDINWEEELGEGFMGCFRQESKRHGWEIKKLRWLEDQGRPNSKDFPRGRLKTKWRSRSRSLCESEASPRTGKVVTHSKSRSHESNCNGEIRKILPEEQERTLSGEASSCTKDPSQVAGFLKGTKEL